MLKCLTTIIIICLFCTNLNREVTADTTQTEALIDVTLRNLLVIRETFPKVPGFWVNLMLSKKASKLRPKSFWGSAFRFIRSAAKVAWKVAKVASVFVNPLLPLAMEVAETVVDVAVEHVKGELDKNRPPTVPDATPEPLKAWFCVEPSSWGGCYGPWTYRVLATKNRKSLELASKILNDISDSNRTIRRHIVATTNLMVKTKHDMAKMSEALLNKQISLISTNLLMAADSLVITSIEDKK